MSNPRVIVALDFPDTEPALALAARLDPARCAVKVGKELFVSAGPDVVRELVARGFKVFLDLKFHDIPNTVAGAAREATRMGVLMFNVHASGGRAMMAAAAEGAASAARELGRRRPIVLAVTVLTSLDRATMGRELRVADSVEGHVLHLAGLAADAGLDGCVASPQEIRALRRSRGPGWVIVTPGVRPAGSALGDQSRIATPASAVSAGAHYLVVGRPITAAPDPARAAEAVLREMGA
jgi:orotidine-5'-phosphate decarboxylase